MDARGTDEIAAATSPVGGDLTGASATTLAAVAVSIAVGLLRSKVVALVLGPFGVGAFATLNLYLSSATVLAAAAAGQGAVRALAQMNGDDPRRHWLQRYLFVGPLAVALGLTLVSALLVTPLARLLLGRVDLNGAVILMVAAIPVAVVASSYTHLLQSLLRVGTIARADIVTTVISLPMTAILVVAFGLEGGVIAVAGAFAVRLVALRLFSPGVVPHGRWALSIHIPPGALRPILSVGSSVAFLGIATTLGALLIRSEIVRTLGLEANGLYQPIVAVSDTYLDLVIGATSVFLLPRLTELIARRERATAERELSHGFRLSLAVTVPLILIAVGWSDIVVRLLYSAEFASASWPLSVQMAGTILKVVSWSVGAALIPLGLTRAWVLSGVLVVALRYLGVVLLTPSFDLLGAALASDIAWAAGAIVTIAVVHRSGRLSVGRSDLFRAGLAAGLVVAVLASREFGIELSAIAAAGAAAFWLVVARHELTALTASLFRQLRSRRRRDR